MDDYYPFLDSFLFIFRSIAGTPWRVLLGNAAIILVGVLGAGVLALIQHNLPERAGRILVAGLVLIMITFMLTFRVPLRPETKPPQGVAAKAVAISKS